MNDQEEDGVQAQTSIPGHESSQEFSGDSYVPKFPKPAKRPRNDTRHIKARSKAQERQLARSFRSAGFTSAKRVPGSGALSGLPADVDPGQWFLSEAKETRTGKITIDPEWVRKISAQAKQVGRPWWALHVWVGEETGPYKKVVILDEDHFFQLMSILKENT